MPAEPPHPLRHPHAGGIGPPQGTPVPPLGFRGHLESTCLSGVGAPRLDSRAAPSDNDPQPQTVACPGAGHSSDGFCPLLPPLGRECLPVGRLSGSLVAVSLPLIIF